MTVESATYLSQFDVSLPVGGDSKAEGDNHIRLMKTVLQATFPGLSGRAWRVQQKSSNYNLASTDNMSIIEVTAGGVTIGTAAALATLGNGFIALIYSSTQSVIFDPNSTETINGATITSWTVEAGNVLLVVAGSSYWTAVDITTQGDNSLVSTVGGTANAITLTPSPAITSYLAGQTFTFAAASANTAATTVAISGLTAKDITKHGTAPLVPGDIQAGALIKIMYDGTRFQIISPPPRYMVGEVGYWLAVPSLWVELNGQTLSKTTYAVLWAYGQGFTTADQANNPGKFVDVDASNFKVPNLSGYFLRGSGQVDANHVAGSVGAKQADVIASHTHQYNTYSTILIDLGPAFSNAAITPTSPQTSAQAGAGTETRPINVALVPCIYAGA